jgi:hypothetical protein
MNLRVYLAIENMSVTEFSKKINYNLTYISKLIGGKHHAGRKLAKIVEKATDGKVKMPISEKDGRSKKKNTKQSEISA